MGDREMDDNRWVNERMAGLEPAPEWKPNSVEGLSRFQGRKRAAQSLQRRLAWTSATAAAIFAGAMWMPVSGSCAPPPSTCTQRLWQRVLRIDPPAPVVQPVLPEPPKQVAEAVPPVAPAPPAPAVPVKAKPSKAAIVRNYKEFGSAKARVVCEIYTDYQCPGCAIFYRDLMPLLMTEYVQTGKVRVVHRDFPLPVHAYARLAARYANAAGQLGYYEAAVNQIFATQAQWSVSGDVDAAVAQVVPPAVMPKVRELVERDAKPEESVARDVTAGRGDQLRQTPTIVVVAKGKRVLLPGTPSYNLLKSYLDQELQ
jgi:protein-disulfide isomerase